MYDTDRSQRIVSELRALRCTLTDVVQAFVTLNCDDLHTDSFAELLELLNSQREIDKILHHAKRKGSGILSAYSEKYIFWGVWEKSVRSNFISGC